MKTYSIGAYFIIDAENKEEALFQACEMQSVANDSQLDNRHKGLDRILLIDENSPIIEETIEVILINNK